MAPAWAMSGAASEGGSGIAAVGAMIGVASEGEAGIASDKILGKTGSVLRRGGIAPCFSFLTLACGYRLALYVKKSVQWPPGRMSMSA